jgi:hypothetical protein
MEGKCEFCSYDMHSEFPLQSVNADNVTDHYELLASVKLAGPQLKVADYFVKLLRSRSERYNCKNNVKMIHLKTLNAM